MKFGPGLGRVRWKLKAFARIGCHSLFRSITARGVVSRMDRHKSVRRVQIVDSHPPRYDSDAESPVTAEDGVAKDDPGWRRHRRSSSSNVTEDQEPFMGIKVRRKTSLHRDYRGDYINVPSHSYLMKMLGKQGDKNVLFADKVFKFTVSGKMKKRIFLLTDLAIYIFDPEAETLKRRIVLAAVEKVCLSELSDNFFAIVIPTEYDLLMASARKTEIVTVLVEATKSASNYELEVAFSNRFQYRAGDEVVKEVKFEEVEGGVKTRILRS